MIKTRRLNYVLIYFKKINYLNIKLYRNSRKRKVYIRFTKRDFKKKGDLKDNFKVKGKLIEERR